MNKIFKKILLFFQILLIISCLSQTTIRGEETGKISIAEVHAEYVEAEPPLPTEDYLTIIAVGDNLYHNVMIRDGEEGDYISAYTEIKQLVQEADIAFINQETMLGGEDFGFTGYPQFNSPQALGRAIAEIGFNVVNHANNHVMDKGEKAVIATMDLWDTMPQVAVLGIHRDEESRNKPVLLTINNITVGFLGYTFGTNGLPVPRGKPWMVSLIDTKIMAGEIDAIRPLCDFLVVSMHWGDEYDHNYNKRQKDLAELFAKHDVDLIIGHHPHVIQKVEFVPKPQGGEMLCYYSLGNFLSAQSEAPRWLGAMAYVKLKKSRNETGEPDEIAPVNIVIEEYGALPLVTHFEKGHTGFKVYPLYDYTSDLAKKHWKDGVTLDYFQKLSLSIFQEKMLSANPF